MNRTLQINAERYESQFLATRLAPFTTRLIKACQDQQQVLTHGNLPLWQAAVDNSPPLSDAQFHVNDGVVEIVATLTDTEHSRLHDSLCQLMPWRKGPFRIAGIDIDTEWRSDWKWNRLIPHIQPLDGRTVLDVGCGSGYHLWRMYDAGAAVCVGIDPGLLFLQQFELVQKYLNNAAVAYLPMTLDALPPDLQIFDTAFSMGVLYHRRDPAAHLQELHAALRPGGELVLETLAVDQPDDQSLPIDGRYAQMRNIWELPSPARLCRWLASAGFENPQTVSLDVTSTDEQRSTAWMTRHSLREALHPDEPQLSVEGYPRPCRAIVIATR